jgi:DNA-binding MarR family transcriptional regulator
MTDKRPDDVQPSRPEPNLEQRAFLSLLRAADFLARGLEEALKPTGLTGTQYNALRILRGAGAGGLACREIGARMLTHDPDVTRLLDRLERRGLIRRHREATDRRVVTTRLTEEGGRLVDGLDDAVAQLHRRQLGHLSPEQLQTLIDLLQGVRGAQA